MIVSMNSFVILLRANAASCMLKKKSDPASPQDTECRKRRNRIVLSAAGVSRNETSGVFRQYRDGCSYQPQRAGFARWISFLDKARSVLDLYTCLLHRAHVQTINAVWMTKLKNRLDQDINIHSSFLCHQPARSDACRPRVL